MSSYRVVLIVVSTTFLVMLGVPTLLRIAGHSSFGEIYPLSRWSMFNKVNALKHDYGLRLVSLDGAPTQPVYLEKSTLSSAHSITAYHAVQKLGAQLASASSQAPTNGEDSETLRAARELVERVHLDTPGAIYEIVSRTWDPIDRWQTGTLKSERVVRRLVAEQ